MNKTENSSLSSVFGNPWVRLVLIISAVVLSVFLIYYMRSIFFPLVLAFVIAYVLDPLVDKLSKPFFPRALISAIFVLLLIVVFVLILLYFIPKLFDEILSFVKSIPDYVEKIKQLLEPHIQKLQEKYPIEVDKVIKSISAEAQKKLPNIAESATNIFLNTFTNLLSFILGLIKLIFIPIFTFFLLKDIDKIRLWTKNHLPFKYKDKIVNLVNEIDAVLGSYLRGQLLICLIIGSYYCIGFILIGVPFGLMFGILIGAVNFVPYMGVFIGVLPALLLTLVETGSSTKILLIFILYVAQQIWDGMYMTPSILGKKVGLHPVFILLSLMIFGKLFGIIGILIAVPSAAVIKVLVKRWLQSYRAKQLEFVKAAGSEKSRKSKR
jgi:sporulation integral membrane protein YtvI